MNMLKITHCSLMSFSSGSLKTWVMTKLTGAAINVGLLAPGCSVTFKNLLKGREVI